MMSHQLFAAMPPALAAEILEDTFAGEKAVYRLALDAVAQLRKVRPVFLERQPRAERNAALAAGLARPALAVPADSLLRAWLLKKQSALLGDFLDALKIPNESGAVDSLPQTVEDAALQSAIELLLGKHRPELVALYLHAFAGMNQMRWPNLEAQLQSDPRLQLRREA